MKGDNKDRKDSGHRNNYGFNPSGFIAAERTMHKAKCSECGTDCEVPFQPTEGKPVYCRDCYRKHRRF